jgi:plastocyanin
MRRAVLTTTLALTLLAWPGVTALAADPTVQAESLPGENHVFRPATVFIMPGHTVRWHNKSGKHNVCWAGTSNCIGGDPVAHTPTDTRWDAQRTFNSQGTFKYYCSEHADSSAQFGMVGKVVVDGKPPVITNLSVKLPNVKFHLSEAAKVFGDVRRDKAGTTFKQVFGPLQRKAGDRSVSYSGSGLAPGKYILRLRARDVAGNAAKPLTAKFTKS